MNKHCIQTYYGQAFDFDAPSPLMVNIYTIARVLSRLPRFGGHLAKNYTVAEHSVWVAERCQSRWALEGLMHDSTEAYIGDIVRPLKRKLDEVEYVEATIQAVIWEKYGLIDCKEMWDEVKHWDNVAVAAEGRQLFLTPPIDGWHREYPQTDERIVPLGDESLIYQRFIDTFYKLKEERDKYVTDHSLAGSR